MVTWVVGALGGKFGHSDIVRSFLAPDCVEPQTLVSFCGRNAMDKQSIES